MMLKLGLSIEEEDGGEDTDTSDLEEEGTEDSIME